MTVSELKGILENMPGEAEVVLYNGTAQSDCFVTKVEYFKDYSYRKYTKGKSVADNQPEIVVLSNTH